MIMLLNKKIGSIHIALEETSSTNTYLKNYLAHNDSVKGTFVSAQFQTSGKGIGRNVWFSEYGKNLLVSFLVFPEAIKAGDQFLISKLFSLAIKKMVEEILDTGHITIKWPNDIYWKDRKIAGILIENRVCGDTISESIAGIGINVNQDVFPKNIPNPVSMFIIKKKQYPIALLLEQLITQICTLNQYYTTNRDLLDIDYRKALYRLETPSIFKSDKEQFKGIIQDVDSYGRLMIKDDKRIRKFDFKQIEFVI